MTELAGSGIPRKLPRHTRPMTYEERCEHDGLLNAPLLLDPKHEALLAEGIDRAGGSTVCPACMNQFQDHPAVVGALWATQMCDGRLVKL